MRLVVIVIWILPKNYDTHIRQRRQFEGTIDVFGSGEDAVFSTFSLDESLQFPEIRFRKLTLCNRSPTGRKTLGDVCNVSQGKLSVQTFNVAKNSIVDVTGKQ